MKILYDGPADRLLELMPTRQILAGQLLTPLTRYRSIGGVFGVDNGAFSRFDERGFLSLLKRQHGERDNCLFVAVPDIVGNARRTLEVFDFWYGRLEGWPLALVIQDGQEDLPIPWDFIDCVFIGGTTEFKMSDSSRDIIKAAKMMRKHVHIGRVNTPKRFKYFDDLGADTCDGSGISRFDWMLDNVIAGQFDDHPLFDNLS